ncbi:hypothetical protein KQ874_02660 [Mycoplasma sp. ES3157-GEN-MYC]|uniref:Uncharacterized protein n=1 Tax=Mycoplasma miroungigenitalium TaxID=754515 RepID=A0A6M4JC91_9MOLU|nr:hypothetical protein [Mycoplasma miroungigenitalium]MBU4690580.1 hypothetical protein [Mycoplasma miroungigenitalium]MBU4691847.1 hypothetical protein [Mycoplasma miroungigenitalium]QJR43707.1 hypothetical protein HLA87_02865 [Mycoplasma miroungigenitalium]
MKKNIKLGLPIIGLTVLPFCATACNSNNQDKNKIEVTNETKVDNNNINTEINTTVTTTNDESNNNKTEDDSKINHVKKAEEIEKHNLEKKYNRNSISLEIAGIEQISLEDFKPNFETYKKQIVTKLADGEIPKNYKIDFYLNPQVSGFASNSEKKGKYKNIGITITSDKNITIKIEFVKLHGFKFEESTLPKPRQEIIDELNKITVDSPRAEDIKILESVKTKIDLLKEKEARNEEYKIYVPKKMISEQKEKQSSTGEVKNDSTVTIEQK